MAHYNFGGLMKKHLKIYLGTIFLIFFNCSAYAKLSNSLVQCISFSTLQETVDESEHLSYLNPKVLEFSGIGEVQEVKNQLSGEFPASQDRYIKIKLFDEDTLLVLNDHDNFERAVLNEDLKMHLDKYSYIGHGVVIPLTDNSVTELSLLCYLSKNEARVPTVVNFKTMISKNLNQVSEVEFAKLVKSK